jgi:hypothetical protein
MTMRGLSRIWIGTSIAVICGVLSACSPLHGSSSPAAEPTTATLTAGPPTTQSGAAEPPTSSAEPGILAVTSAGALVRLNPATGAVAQTLVPSGVVGDEISVANGTVYFTSDLLQQQCDLSVESVPEAGGTPTVIGPGAEPAVSPDGTKLAYTTAPSIGGGPNCGTQYGHVGQTNKLMIRTLANGQTVTIPQQPASFQGFAAPDSHLSWSPDGSHLAVSIAEVQDNEGWTVNLVDVTTAQYFQTGTGVSTFTTATENAANGDYLREVVYLPDGDLFVSQACCAGAGESTAHKPSRLLLETSPKGTLTKQVAIGYPTLTHDSLAVATNGDWLLYLGGGNLYVSKGGATPTELSKSDFLAATWAG